MSQLLDSLRRASRSARGDRSKGRRLAAAAAILASMRDGTARKRNASKRRGALLAAAIAGAVLSVSVLAWSQARAVLSAGAAVASPGIGTTPAPEPPPAAPPEGSGQRPAATASVRAALPASRADLQPSGTGGSSGLAEPGVGVQTPGRPAGAAEPPDEFTRALDHHRNGDLERAGRLYRALIARAEMPAQAQNNLGLLHQQQGQLDKAVRAFEQALLHEPRYAKAHNNLGVALLALGRVEAAMARFREAVNLDRRDPDAIVNLALAEKAAGRPEQAKESLLAALGLSPRSPPAHYNLAVLYDQSGERARAAEHYRAFLEHRGTEYAARAADVRLRLAAFDAGR